MLFALGKPDPALADLRVYSVRQLFDKIPGSGGLQCGHHVRIAGAGPGEAQIVGDRAVEEKRFLRHQPDLLAQRAEIEVAHIHPTEHYVPPGNIVVTQQQIGQGGLARPGVPDQGSDLARRQRERKIGQHRRSPRIAVVHFFVADLGHPTGNGLGSAGDSISTG